MKNWPFWIGCLAAAAIALFFFWPETEEQIYIPPSVEETPHRAGSKPPAEVRHPVAEIPTAADVPDAWPDRPLPVLEQSDDWMAEQLARLFRDKQLERFFRLEHFIERFVAMVDNLPREQLPVTHRPFKPIPGDFRVTATGNDLYLDPANAHRYRPLLDLLESVDPATVTTLYVRLYPLFQQAYEKLGYADRYFNDRLVEVIDHLLETPEVAGPFRLKRPKYYYRYADPRLEALSAGQKAMLRIGPENRGRVKELLEDYRRRLAGAVSAG